MLIFYIDNKIRQTTLIDYFVMLKILCEIPISSQVQETLPSLSIKVDKVK